MICAIKIKSACNWFQEAAVNLPLNKVNAEMCSGLALPCNVMVKVVFVWETLLQRFGLYRQRRRRRRRRRRREGGNDGDQKNKEKEVNKNKELRSRRRKLSRKRKRRISKNMEEKRMRKREGGRGCGVCCEIKVF
jgi:hypothetical protein